MPKDVFKLFFILIYLQGIPGFSQPDFIESSKKDLLGKVENAPFDSLKADLYLKIAELYQNSYKDSFVRYADFSMAISRESNYFIGEIRVNLVKGFNLYLFGDHLEGMELIKKGLSQSEEKDYIFGLAKSNNYLGLVYIYEGELSSALKCQQKFLDYSEQIQDEWGVADAYTNIALVHFNFKNYEESEKYYLKAYDMQSRIGNKEGMGYIKNSLGRIYMEKNDIERALSEFMQSYQIQMEVGNLKGLVYALNSISKVSILKGKMDEALLYLNEALEYSLEINYLWGECSTNIDLGNYFLKMEQYRKAIEVAEKGYLQAKQLSSNQLIAGASGVLNKAYKGVGNYQKALEYQGFYFIYNDSLLGEEQARKIEKLETEFQLAQSEMENNRLKQENLYKDEQIKRQRVTVFAGVSILILVGIFIFFLLKVNKREHRFNKVLLAKNKLIQSQKEELEMQSEEIGDQNAELFARNEALSNLNREKDTLMHIVAHDLRAPLNQIKGLVELISIEGHSEKSFSNYIEKIKQVVSRGDHLINDLLEMNILENKDIQIKQEALSVEQFLKSIAASFEQVASVKKIKIALHTHGDNEIFTDKDILTRILDNLISNAIKFSFPNSEVKIKTNRNHNTLTIAVIDSGPGIKESDKEKVFGKFQKLSAQPTAGEPSTGLGLYIVRLLTEKINGKIGFESKESSGTTFLLELPLVTQGQPV
ncbi:tetratricopeptide repeat-containing sensor histidine kinase [Flexithrix dorotheae]|uniref:tetratricopeptide repeat-containing sensor histidine kinase n=1 Tax=Flexithrix dorotheae TaxID=70993 RepID=UPI00037D3897|nr:tetratricopeptide repeat-containing sensor histidine kinase [Flexithrix dorotheae]